MSEIVLHISDMKKTTTSLKSDVLARIGFASPKKVWTVRDFLDLGPRDTVDKTLQRLTTEGSLRRVARGLYDVPSLNPLTKKNNPANTREVIDAVARRDQIRLLVDGITAANDLGFTNAVPAKIVVHTDSRLKTINMGNLTIVFKTTAASKLYWAGRPAMRIVQALHWLRDTLGQEEGQDKKVQDHLLMLLKDDEQGAVLREDLTSGFATLPAWMQSLLRPMLNKAGLGQ